MNNLTIFTNTHSSCRDIWPMYFGQLEKHWPGHPKHRVGVDWPGVDALLKGRTGFTYWPYNSEESFSSQYLDCLGQIDTEFVLTMQEDFVLYDDVDVEVIEGLLEMVAGDSLCQFIRLILSGLGVSDLHKPHAAPHGAYYGLASAKYPYSMQATIWRTDVLRTLYAELDADTPWEAEAKGCEVIKGMWRNVNGVAYYDGGPKRGHDHWDSLCFPYMSTALVRGKWNMAEYDKELWPLFEEYDIDPSERGALATASQCRPYYVINLTDEDSDENEPTRKE